MDVDMFFRQSKSIFDMSSSPLFSLSIPLNRKLQISIMII